jgi:hypothetical protein
MLSVQSREPVIKSLLPVYENPLYRFLLWNLSARDHFRKRVQLSFFHGLNAYFPPFFHRTASPLVIDDRLDENDEEILKKG